MPKRLHFHRRELASLQERRQLLRRTFITAAESLDLKGFILKKLLNHRTIDNDVTGGYIVWKPKRLLKPLCRIEQLILEGPDDEEE